MARPVLVFYLEIGNLPPEDVATYFEMVSDRIGNFDNEYHKIIIPTKTGESRVDLLSPNLVYSDEKDIKKFKTSSKRLIKETEQLLRRMPYLSRNILLIEKT
jgi:hypothetical protein